MSNNEEKAKNTAMPKKEKKQRDPIVTIIVAVIVILIVVALIWTDYQVRQEESLTPPSTSSEPVVEINGPVNDENDASNVIFGKNVITNNPHITTDTPAEIIPYPAEDINGVSYYKVTVNIFKEQLKEEEELTEEEKAALYAPESIIFTQDYYVAASDSEIYVKDATGNLVVFDFVYE